MWELVYTLEKDKPVSKVAGETGRHTGGFRENARLQSSSHLHGYKSLVYQE